MNSKNLNFLHIMIVQLITHKVSAEVTKVASVYSLKLFVSTKNETIFKMRDEPIIIAANSILSLIRPRFELMPKIA